MKFACLVTVLSLASVHAPAQTQNPQPFINYRGVLNAASFEGQGLPGGSIAQGSIFTIFGSNLGPSQIARSSSYALPNQLAGVSVSVTQGATTLAAIPLVALNSQVNAIMPSNAKLGQAIVRVSYNGATSNPAIVNVVAASPGLFSILTTGFGPGVVQNYVSAGSQPINTTQTTARPGQTVIVWGTGLGAVPYADNVAPQPGNLPTQVDVFVGNVPVTTLSYRGRSPCCAGLDQIVFDVPANAPTGCYVPVQVRANGAIVSNAITISIGPAGAPCSDDFNSLGAAVRAGGNNGIVSAGRIDYLLNIGPDPPGEGTQDLLNVDLRDDAGGATYFSPLYSLPPVGTCAMYSGRAFDGGAGTVFFAPAAKALDGGVSLQVAANGANASVGRVPGAEQLYGALLAEQPAITGLPTQFFNFPGAFTLTIPGGADVQKAQVNGTTPGPFEWTNRSTLETVNRASGLTVTWTGGNPSTDVAEIAIEASNDAANSVAMAVCLAPISAGSFSFPPEILQSLPPSPVNATRAPAWVSVGSAPLLVPGTFSAGGLKGGFLIPGYAAINAVTIE